MPATILVLIAIGVNPISGRFLVDHPQSARVLAPDGHIAHASGFLADMGTRDPVEAARGFLADYGDAFGTAGGRLVLAGAPATGSVGAVRFARMIDGLPVFGSDLVVGLDAQARVLLVNSGPAALATSGSHLIGEALAYRSAVASLGASTAGVPTIVAGWRPFFGAARAVYRVDFIAQSPAGDWRVFVDGATGQALFREDLRFTATAPGSVFELSPVESAAALCPIASSGGRSFCATPSAVSLPNLSTGAGLTGSQTTVYNCSGADAPTTTAGFPGSCGTVAASAGGFSFPVDSTWTSLTDDFSAAMAYYHLDRHVSFFKALDSTLPPSSGTANGSSRALRGSLPALVNARQGGAPLENAFFSGGLDAMVFGQGASADYAYDATVMYHEFTHGAVFAWGGFSPDIDALGGLDEPGGLNEGTADAMAASETGRSTIGGFIGSTSTPAAPYLRDMNDPGAARTCQGNGTVVTRFGASTVNGLDGEVHDDGEIWNGYYWEVFDGLRTAGVKGCSGGCEAGPAIQYKAMQLSGGTGPTFNAYWQTFKAAASSMFTARPSIGAYVDCVARRRKLDRCDRTVPLFAGETKLQFVRLRYSPFQVAVQAAGPTQFAVCSAKGTATTIHVRLGQPVQLSAINPSTLDATFTEDGSGSFTQPCSGGAAVFSLPSAGTWYLLVDSPNALVGGNPGFEIYKYETAASGMTARPGAAEPVTCTPPFPLAISPPSPSVPPRGHLTLAGSGGSAAGYSWAVTANNSGGSIAASTGDFTAGPIGSVTDVVQLTDSVGETTTRSVAISAGVSIQPATASLAPGGHQTFTASGGSGSGFAWSLGTNASGGRIDAGGNYTVGSTGSVTDVVQVTDSLGNSATATVAVSAAPEGGCTTGGSGNAAAMLVLAAAMLVRWFTRKREAT